MCCRSQTCGQFAQRIARRFELQPLSSTEVQDYIDRRLFVAAGLTSVGNRNRDDIPPDHVDQAPRVEFSPPAIQAVVGISKGVPRVVNTLCDRSLEVAFERETHTIDASIVREAARRLKLPVPAFVPRSGAVRAAAAAASIVLAVALGAYWWLRPVPGPPGEPDRGNSEVAAPAGTPSPSTDRPAASGGALPAPPAPAVPPSASDTKTRIPGRSGGIQNGAARVASLGDHRGAGTSGINPQHGGRSVVSGRGRSLCDSRSSRERATEAGARRIWRRASVGGRRR